MSQNQADYSDVLFNEHFKTQIYYIYNDEW